MNLIQQLEHEEAQRLQETRTTPDFQPGDTLRVNVRIKEGERERVQAFEGVCIARAGQGIAERQRSAAQREEPVQTPEA